MSPLVVTYEIRRATALQWADVSKAGEYGNYVAAAGEPMLETDTRKLKFGDGSTPFRSLEYQEAGISQGTGDQRYPHFTGAPVAAGFPIALPGGSGPSSWTPGLGLFSTATGAEFRPERFTIVTHGASFKLAEASAKDEAPKLHVMTGGTAATAEVKVPPSKFLAGDTVQILQAGGSVSESLVAVKAEAGMTLKPAATVKARGAGALVAIVFITPTEAWVIGDTE